MGHRFRHPAQRLNEHTNPTKFEPLMAAGHFCRQTVKKSTRRPFVTGSLASRLQTSVTTFTSARTPWPRRVWGHISSLNLAEQRVNAVDSSCLKPVQQNLYVKCNKTFTSSSNNTLTSSLPHLHITSATFTSFPRPSRHSREGGNPAFSRPSRTPPLRE